MECPICFEADFTGYVATRCGHVFHETCLNVWWAESPDTCPACRQKISCVPYPEGNVLKIFSGSDHNLAFHPPVAPPSGAPLTVRQTLETRVRELEEQLHFPPTAARLARQVLRKGIGECFEVQSEVARRNEIDQELAAVRDQCGELTATNDAAVQELETLLAQLDESRVAKEIAITEKVSQADSFKIQVEDLERKVSDLEAVRDSLQDTVKGLTADKDQLHEIVESLLETGQNDSCAANKEVSSENPVLATESVSNDEDQNGGNEDLETEQVQNLAENDQGGDTQDFTLNQVSSGTQTDQNDGNLVFTEEQVSSEDQSTGNQDFSADHDQNKSKNDQSHCVQDFTAEEALKIAENRGIDKNVVNEFAKDPVEVSIEKVFEIVGDSKSEISEKDDTTTEDSAVVAALVGVDLQGQKDSADQGSQESEGPGSQGPGSGRSGTVSPSWVVPSELPQWVETDDDNLVRFLEGSQ